MPRRPRRPAPDGPGNVRQPGGPGTARQPADGWASSGTARLLWIALYVLAALRLLLARAPGMALWAFNLPRFLPPAAAWAPLILAALALLPPVGRALARAVTALAAVPSLPALAAFLAVAAAAGAAWLLPDRVFFTGDFLIRAGTNVVAGDLAKLFPQALPLDLLLHYQLPRWLAARYSITALAAERIQGAVELGLLSGVAVGLARGRGLPPSLAVGTWAAVLGGGYVALFTGYPKSFVELALIAAATACVAVRVGGSHGGAGHGAGQAAVSAWWVLALGVLAAAAIALHRSGAAFLPGALLACGLWARARGTAALRSAALWIAVVLPVATLLKVAPRIAASLHGIDRMHLAPAGSGGVLGAAFAPLHLLDLVNLALLLSPLFILLPLLLGGTPRNRRRSAAGWSLTLLAAPWLVVCLFVHPIQGVFSDWDVFAAGGVMLSCLVAWALGEALREVPSAAWIGLAAGLAALGPSAQWMIHNNLPEQGIARVHAYLVEPPARPAPEAAQAWCYLGFQYFAHEEMDLASAAFAHASDFAPSANILTYWGESELRRGHREQARGLFRRAVRRDPDFERAWLKLAATSSDLDDPPEERRALHALYRLDRANLTYADIFERMRELDSVSATPGAADSLGVP